MNFSILPQIDRTGKKRRYESNDIWTENTQDSSHLEEDRLLDSIWHDHSLFLLDDPLIPDDALATTQQVEVEAELSIRNRKRVFDDLAWTNELNHLNGNPPDPVAFSDSWFEHTFPGLFPSLPLPEHRDVRPDKVNPFSEDSVARYSARKQAAFKLPEHGAVDGYIKLRLRAADNVGDDDDNPRRRAFTQKSMAIHHRPTPPLPGEIVVPALPPDFGQGNKLDETDKKLWKFYTGPFCNGRTLMSKTNFWLVDIAPLADGNECVLHALLASTAAYVLDYIPRDGLQRRANYHYRRAADLLSQSLADPKSQEVGKEDSIIAALLLLACDDIVNWELQKKGVEPKWRQGNRLAKRILDNADPGFKHWSPVNVQSSKARITLANRIAFIDILVQPVTPLEISQNDRMYGWLVEGTDAEVSKIHGGTGLCSKLLHTFAQITHFAALMAETPDSPIIPHGAAKIAEILAKLHQWSEFSLGYVSPTELFKSCILNDDGKVFTAKKVTELTGEAWRSAAQIYLLCRFYRIPRSHPDVLAKMDVLVKCIEWMPYTGPLFTSQMPFFPVFLIGMTACRENHRQVARDWFDVVVSGASCRSSVPPIWNIVQSLWEWMDTELHDDTEIDRLPIGEREPWWEKVVARLIDAEGILSLC